MHESGFGTILAVTAIYGVVHSLLASHTAKRWAEKAFGVQARRFYRLLFSMIAVLGLIPPVILAFLLPDQRLYAIPLPWVLITLAVQAAAGLALLITVMQTDAWAFIGLRQLGEAPALIARPGDLRLVTTGAYRWVRHPLYSFSFILLWLMPVMSWNFLALILGLSLYMLAGIWFEERKLLAEFGPVYADYCSRTKLLIPWIL